MWSLNAYHVNVLTVTLFCALSRHVVDSFVLSKHPRFRVSKQQQQQQCTYIEGGLTLTKISKNMNEISVVDDEYDDNEDDKEGEEDYKVDDDSLSSVDIHQNTKKTQLQYASLSPGLDTVQIQVGDLALARKAWKKRRRSGSPLLVPCSILNLDRTSMLKSNMIYLLYKFGCDQKDGIVLSLTELSRRHKSHLKSSLLKHATALSYDSPRELVEALFQSRGKSKDSPLGVALVRDENDDELYLKLPISKYRALKNAQQMVLLQVTAEPVEETGTLRHTGFIRTKRTEEDGPGPFFAFHPVSAALRVSQREDVETGNIQNGSIHSAVVFDFDPQGDAGSPLLTLSLNPSRRKASLTQKLRNRSSSGNVHSKYMPIQKPKHLVNNLQLGQGPFNAKIIHVDNHGALVDFGVGRRFQAKGKNDQSVGLPEYVKVFGRLRFKDDIESDNSEVVESNKKKSKRPKGDESQSTNVEQLLQKLEDDMDDKLEEGEQTEDITHLFELNEDGLLIYRDPQTGQSEVVSGIDDDDDDGGEEDEDNDVEETDEPVTFFNNVSPSQQQTAKLFLKKGDKIQVYILSVSKQSSQFTVTTDPSSVQGKNAKDIKKEGDVTKKLERLDKLLGGLERAEELRGCEYFGTVKATSHTGDWLYVQPQGENNEDLPLPVGIATVSDKTSSLAQGDRVRIRMEGIDHTRGQLAMHVLEKLSP